MVSWRSFIWCCLMADRWNAWYSLWLGAVLEVTHSADRFGLLTDITIASVDHLAVSLLSASVFSVLITCTKTGSFYYAWVWLSHESQHWDIAELQTAYMNIYFLPPAHGLEHWDQLFKAHSKVSSWMTLLLLIGTESSWIMYLYMSVDLVSLSLGIICKT